MARLSTLAPAALIRSSLLPLLLAALLLLGASTALAASTSTSPPAKHPASGPPANPTWSHPFSLGGPYSADVLPAQIAFSSAGEAAVAYAVYDEDAPQISQGYLVTRSPAGQHARPRRLPHSQEVLGLAFDGSVLDLLSGTSPVQYPCCSSATALTFNNNRFGRMQTLATGLDGATLASLTPLPGQHVLAALAAESGVWVAQSPTVGHFRSSRRLTGPTSAPETLASAGLRDGRSAVAWTAGTVDVFDVAPDTIELATGTDQKAPSSARVAVTVPAGHSIDELSLAGGPAGPTAGWIESWFDSAGNLHSEAVVADLTGRLRPRTFPVSGQLASSLTLAADAKGDQAMAWKTCTTAGSCSVRAISRAAGKRFGGVQRLGALDAGQEPAAAVASDGDALVGWIDGSGHVLASSRHGADGRFGSAKTVSSAGLAADLTLAFGPSDQALAAWTQGTVAPSVVAAYYP